MTSHRSLLSLWSTDSVLCIGSQGSALSWMSMWSVMSDRSTGGVLDSRRGRVTAAAPAALVAAAAVRSHP